MQSLSMLPDPAPAAGARSGTLVGDLSSVDCWLFDLDNTLYPARANLFAEIDRRMQAYVGRLLGLPADEARALQKKLFRTYGTTLSGLMQEYHVSPNDFLADVHDIDVSVLVANPRLRRALRSLPGRRLVFTNADCAYARRVLAALGIDDCFDGIFDIEAMGWQPKPNPVSYRRVLARHGASAGQSLFVDDMALNLAPAKALGLRTAWVNNGSERGSEGYRAEAIDFELTDLTDWLENLLP